MENIKELRNNYDIVFKEALMLYKNKTLDFLGLDLATIEEPINTEMTELKVNKSFTDMGFILKDKTGLHLEWEVDISSDDMLRFCSYNLNYLRMYKSKFTTVIFTNKPQIITCFENEMLRFTPIIINLGERDGDALLQKLTTQIENKEQINELELIYLPLYHSKYKNAAEMLGQVVELAPKIPNLMVDNEKIMILSAAVANKFIDADDFGKIWEEIKMYMDDLLIVKFAKEEGKEEGKKEGKEEGKKEGKIEGLREGERKGKIEVALSMLKKGLDIETVAECTNLTVDELEKIKETA